MGSRCCGRQPRGRHRSYRSHGGHRGHGLGELPLGLRRVLDRRRSLPRLGCRRLRRRLDLFLGLAGTHLLNGSDYRCLFGAHEVVLRDGEWLRPGRGVPDLQVLHVRSLVLLRGVEVDAFFSSCF